MTFTLLGPIYAKGNRRRLVPNQRTGKTHSIKSREAEAMVASYVLQLRVAWRNRPPLTEPVRLTATLYYQHPNCDLDESLVMDCLQQAGVLTNDRLIKEKHVVWRLDRARPRTECTVEPLEVHP